MQVLNISARHIFGRDITNAFFFDPGANSLDPVLLYCCPLCQPGFLG